MKRELPPKGRDLVRLAAEHHRCTPGEETPRPGFLTAAEWREMATVWFVLAGLAVLLLSTAVWG